MACINEFLQLYYLKRKLCIAFLIVIFFNILHIVCLIVVYLRILKLVLAVATPNALLGQVGISGGHTKCFAGPGWY